MAEWPSNQARQIRWVQTPNAVGRTWSAQELEALVAVSAERLAANHGKSGHSRVLAFQTPKERQSDTPGGGCWDKDALDDASVNQFS